VSLIVGEVDIELVHDGESKKRSDLLPAERHTKVAEGDAYAIWYAPRRPQTVKCL
jgi:hypothetical protein